MEVLVGNLLISCLLLLIFSILSKNKGSQYNTAGIFIIALSFIQVVFVHAAVDINSVPDLPSYQDDYSVKISSLDGLLNGFQTNEFCYYLSNLICRLFSDNFEFYLLAHSIFLVTAYYITFYRYSGDFMLSVVIFLLISYAQSIFVLRQHLAIAICLLSIPLILKRKLWLFLLVGAIAYFTHHSSIVWIPIYFLYNFRNKFAIGSVLVLSLAFILYISSNISFLIDFLDVDYSLYLRDREANSTKTIMMFMYFISYLYFCKGHIFEDGIYRLTTIALFIITIGNALNFQITLIDRLLMYFYVFLAISVPLTLKGIKNHLVGIVFTISVILLQGYVAYTQYQAEWFRNLSIHPLPIFYFLIVLLSAIILTNRFKKECVKQENISIYE